MGAIHLSTYSGLGSRSQELDGAGLPAFCAGLDLAFEEDQAKYQTGQKGPDHE